MGIGNYQRFLTPNFKPFNPLEVAKETEKIVTRLGPEGLERKYIGIYSAPVYRGDPKIMPQEERNALIVKSSEIDQRISNNPEELEEEQIDAYDTTVNRLRAAADQKYPIELEKKITRRQ